MSTGAEYIAEYCAHSGIHDIFAVQGGACAFIIDAMARHPRLRVWYFQHEQAAAMAADAVWRVKRQVGCSVATSGPGAINLLSGIACSYFDSIPSLHITGQVPNRERNPMLRQSGFQQTDVVAMASPITIRSGLAESLDGLKALLCQPLDHGGLRAGPVLIDVPMDIQQASTAMAPFPSAPPPAAAPAEIQAAAEMIRRFLRGGTRPLVLFGAGVGLADAQHALCDWLAAYNMPFVASWNALGYFDHDQPNFLGAIGVYGSRGANFAVQNCDRLLVLGSRLDNRQRSGNASNFAKGAKILCLDIDPSELSKISGEQCRIDLCALAKILDPVQPPDMANEWADYCADMRSRYLGRNVSTLASRTGSLDPYKSVRAINAMIDDDAIVIADTGATVCWVHQVFHRKAQTLFTAGGHSPMGYALPAAIGAKMVCPDREVVCFIGDGGFQMNIQELETVRRYGLDIKIIVMDNKGYGIIRQFQNSYTDGRHVGVDVGSPDWLKLGAAYGIATHVVTRTGEISPSWFSRVGSELIVLDLHPDTEIEPKLEMGRPINDQYPYLSDEEYESGNRFVRYERVRT